MIIERSKISAIEFASKIRLMKNKDVNEQYFTCGVPLLQMKAEKKNSLTHTGKSDKKMVFQNVLKLKNFAEKFGDIAVPEKSPYVERIFHKTKRYIVKKTSLCWLLRTDSEKLSSDRRLRVKQPQMFACKAKKIVKCRPTNKALKPKVKRIKRRKLGK